MKWVLRRRTDPPPPLRRAPLFFETAGSPGRFHGGGQFAPSPTQSREGGWSRPQKDDTSTTRELLESGATYVLASHAHDGAALALVATQPAYLPSQPGIEALALGLWVAGVQVTADADLSLFVVSCVLLHCFRCTFHVLGEGTASR